MKQSQSRHCEHSEAISSNEKWPTLLMEYWHKSISSGFLHILSANFFSYLVVFCGSIAYARLMEQAAFGIYSFTFNIISFFLLVNGFGAASGVLQFVSRTHDTKLRLAYLKYALTLGLAFNGGLSILILAYAWFVPLPIPGAGNALLLMAFFPLGRLYIDVLQAYLRATEQNGLLAKFAITTNSFLCILQILGILYAQLMGLIVATYLAYILIYLLAVYVYRLPNVFALKQEVIQRRQFITYSMYATVGNAFSQLLFILDILILGYMIKSADVVAIYKVATVIPFAIAFIPGVVMTFFYPRFARNSTDYQYVRELKNKVFKGMFVFSLLVSVVLIIIAKPLILFIFGAQYGDSILPFQILSFGFWLSASFRIINGNVLAALGRARFSMLHNLFMMLINICLTMLLVKYYGIIGAACGVIIVYSISAIITTVVLRKILH